VRRALIAIAVVSLVGGCSSTPSKEAKREEASPLSTQTPEGGRDTMKPIAGLGPPATPVAREATPPAEPKPQPEPKADEPKIAEDPHRKTPHGTEGPTRGVASPLRIRLPDALAVTAAATLPARVLVAVALVRDGLLVEEAEGFREVAQTLEPLEAVKGVLRQPRPESIEEAQLRDLARAASQEGAHLVVVISRAGSSAPELLVVDAATGSLLARRRKAKLEVGLAAVSSLATRLDERVR
jgi:hypothetical protein